MKTRPVLGGRRSRQVHRPIDEAAHPSRGVGRRGGFDLHGRLRRRFGRSPYAQAAAGRRLYLPYRLRPTRRAEGADAARRNATGDGLQAIAVRRHPGQQRSTPPCAAAPTCRQALEQLWRYITRPALANERVQTNAAGQVVLKLKTPWRDGTTHLVMSPLEFMQRLAALVPRPRLHLIRLVSA